MSGDTINFYSEPFIFILASLYIPSDCIRCGQYRLVPTPLFDPHMAETIRQLRADGMDVTDPDYCRKCRIAIEHA